MLAGRIIYVHHRYRLDKIMKILRIFIRGSHVRWADMAVADNTDMAHWSKVAEQQGYIVGSTFMVMRDAIDCMALFEGAEPTNNITPFTPRPVA